MDNQDEIRNAVKGWRKRLAMTQIELAKRSEIPQATLSRWESGHINLAEEQLRKIASSIDGYEREEMEKAKSGDPRAILGTSSDPAERGKAIATLRSLHSITQTELAMKAEMSRSSLSLFETGYAAPSEQDEERLKDVLNRLINEKQSAGTSPIPGNNRLLWLANHYNTAKKSEEEIRAEHKKRLLADPYFLLEVNDEAGRQLFERCKELRKQISSRDEIISILHKLVEDQEELISLQKGEGHRKDKKIADLQKRIADLNALCEVKSKEALAHSEAEDLKAEIEAKN